MVLVLIFLTIVSLGLLFWQASNLISVIFGSPYVMVDKSTIREALKLAGLKKGEIFYDLGCGNGDVLIEASKMGAKSTGFEISPFYLILSWLKIYFYNKKFQNTRSSLYNGKVNLEWADIYKIDLSKADIVYCYLMPEMLEKLAPKFQRELKAGTRVVSIGFPIKKMKRKLEQKINFHKIFIYVSP